MAVPTSGDFKMFDTSSNTSIRGAICDAGYFNVDNVDDFGNLIGNTYAWQFDPTYAGDVVNPVVDVYQASQFRNFPFTSSAPAPPPLTCYTWTSIDPLITCRTSMASAGESGTSMLVWSGDCGAYTNLTEAYDGSTWSSQAALTFCYSGMRGTGEQNAALGVSGIQSGTPTGCFNQNTVEYNGTSWSVGVLNNTARGQVGVAGEVNQAVMFGGTLATFPYPTYLTCTEEYNGTSWSVGCSLPSARARNLGVGFQGNALSIGGFGPTNFGAALTCTDEYNGTSWASGGTLPTARQFHAGGGAYNDAIIYGGSSNAPGQLSSADLYNGISWSNTCAMITCRQAHGGAGNTANSTAAGGSNSGTTYLDTAECYGYVTPGVSDGWYRAADLNLGRMYSGFAGRAYEGLLFGGGCLRPSAFNLVPGSTRYCIVSNTEEYVFDSWSESNHLNQKRAEGGGTGVQNAALYVGGKIGSVTYNITEEYNGTTWSTGGGAADYSYAASATGTQNAALYFGGKCDNGNVLSRTLEYNGSSWTSTPASMTVARYTFTAGGTQNATIAAGGSDNTNYLACTEEYNGTSWSTLGAMGTGNGRGAGGGDLSCFITTGGVIGSNAVLGVTAATERYDSVGDTWASGATLPAYRYGLAGGNTTSDANCFFVMGGSDGSWPYTYRCSYRYFTS